MKEYLVKSIDSILDDVDLQSFSLKHLLTALRKEHGDDEVSNNKADIKAYVVDHIQNRAQKVEEPEADPQTEEEEEQPGPSSSSESDEDPSISEQSSDDFEEPIKKKAAPKAVKNTQPKPKAAPRPKSGVSKRSKGSKGSSDMVKFLKSSLRKCRLRIPTEDESESENRYISKLKQAFYDSGHPAGRISKTSVGKFQSELEFKREIEELDQSKIINSRAPRVSAKQKKKLVAQQSEKVAAIKSALPQNLFDDEED